MRRLIFFPNEDVLFKTSGAKSVYRPLHVLSGHKAAVAVLPHSNVANDDLGNRNSSCAADCLGQQTSRPWFKSSLTRRKGGPEGRARHENRPDGPEYAGGAGRELYPRIERSEGFAQAERAC
jgi:hypothetical protein